MFFNPYNIDITIWCYCWHRSSHKITFICCINSLKFLEKSLAEEEIPIAYRLAGEIYLQKGDYQKSVQLLEKAKNLSPENPVIFYHLCRTYHLAGREQEALRLFREMQAFFPASSYVQELRPFFE